MSKPQKASKAFARYGTGPAPAYHYLRITRWEWLRLGRTADEPAMSVTGPDDRSPAQQHYDRRCTLCWDAAAHSVELHQKRVQPR